MSVAVTILAGLAVAFISVLPVWPFSRDWGYAPAILIGVVLLTLFSLTVTGKVPGMDAN
jgi:hypothetical protein